jgi:hypothetical protein
VIPGVRPTAPAEVRQRWKPGRNRGRMCAHLDGVTRKHRTARSGSVTILRVLGDGV